jgi:two-component system CheB/CheR fusion protein
MPFHPGGSTSRALNIFLVDDEPHFGDQIGATLEEGGRTVEKCSSGDGFLRSFHPGQWACLVVSSRLPDMSGMELLARLHHAGQHPAAIIIGSGGGARGAVAALEAGAVDFIEKPYIRADILEGIERAFRHAYRAAISAAAHDKASSRLQALTPREWQIMDLVLDGQPSKNIASDLGISQRTVENHRASIMTKSGTRSLPALARLAMAAAGPEPIASALG